jgi:chaperonin GroEL (HSP60 family)
MARGTAKVPTRSVPMIFLATTETHKNHLWQVLVELAELQDREVGDGTTSVVIIAAELLKVSIP